MEVSAYDGWFTATRMKKGTGHGVALVGFADDGKILIRVEHNPAHQEGFIENCITGAIEKGDTPLITAQKELLEEAGYEAEKERFLYLGWAYPSKFSEYRQHLYMVDLTGLEQGEIEGDGSRGEKGATAKWIELEDSLDIRDNSLAAILWRISLARQGFLGKDCDYEE